jgi:hypothetical protein
MAEEGAKPGMAIHGNEYHDPDFEQEGAAAALIEAHRTAATHTQDQPPAEHGNAKHNPDFEQEGIAASLVGTHEAKTTGIHGVGGSTVESASGSQGKVDTHEAKTTGVHGVGAGTVAKVGDIAVDANLSAAAQDAISKRHTQNTDKIIKDADADTALEVEQSADEDKIRGKVKGVEALLIDSAGVLTLAKQSAVGVYLSASQSIATDIWTKILLNTELFDVQAEFDNSVNYRFTAKTAGLYLVAGSVMMYQLADGTGVFTGIRKNTTDDVFEGRAWVSKANGSANGFLMGAVSLAVNDYLELWVYHTHGSNRDAYGGQRYTYLSVIKIA